MPRHGCCRRWGSCFAAAGTSCGAPSQPAASAAPKQHAAASAAQATHHSPCRCLSTQNPAQSSLTPVGSADDLVASHGGVSHLADHIAVGEPHNQPAGGRRGTDERISKPAASGWGKRDDASLCCRGWLARRGAPPWRVAWAAALRISAAPRRGCSCSSKSASQATAPSCSLLLHAVFPHVPAAASPAPVRQCCVAPSCAKPAANAIS